jgi:hypothetical protein
MGGATTPGAIGGGWHFLKKKTILWIPIKVYVLLPN